MCKYYTRKKIIGLIAEDVSKCTTTEDVFKLKEELLADEELDIEDIILGCLAGALLNKNEAKHYKKLYDSYRSKVPVISRWFNNTFYKQEKFLSQN